MPQKTSSPDYSPNSGENPVSEEAPGTTLPVFDTLPAAAGLDSTEAFRLSQRHALALLPGLIARGVITRSNQENPDRFILR